MKPKFFVFQTLQELFPQLADIHARPGAARITRKQVNALARHFASPAGLDNASADVVIAFLDFRQKRRLASLQQVAKLNFLGRPDATTLTMAEAFQIISRSYSGEQVKKGGGRQ